MRLNIKKAACYIVLMLAFMCVTGCGSKNEEKPKAQENEFEIKVAQNVVELYMKSLMKDDLEGARKLLTKDLSLKTKDEGNSDLKVKGYSIDETSEIGKSGLFKVKVTRMNLTKPVATLDDCSIKVIMEGSDYKIGEVKNEAEKEAFLENYTLRLRSKDNLKTNLLIDSSSFPQYVFSKDDKGNLTKLPVPRSSYSVMNFGYGGEKIAISTFDKDSFLGLIKIDESMTTQGGSTGGASDQSQGDQGKGGGAGGGTAIGREKPIGKQMAALDLIKDSKIEFMTFSNGEKFILAQYNKTNAGRCIRVYNTDSGDLIKVNFENEYSYGKVEIVFSSFDKDVLNYDVIQRDMKDKSAAEQAGKYQLDLKGFKIKRL
ncbi:hypothetical protein [Candidatus Clostridium radicumherbarum]|uniref:Uncharacterized protein n=1 Tax=Candidatus Clostridium radicumherbarum TaxID=3381662 RepID=A0ABW8TTY1_9CLOT